MSSRRPSSRGQSGTKSKQSARRGASQPERSVTGVLLFFLIMFLILLVLLLQARLSSDQSILLGMLLLILIACIFATWLVGRKRRYVAMEPARVPGDRVSSAPAQALPTSHSVSVADLLQLTPSEFEDFVGDLLTATGQYSDVRRIGGAGDRGADLLAKDRFGRPFIVQCKRYQPARKVNAGEMRNFLGAKGIYGADECLFVTTSTFTEAARANMVHLQHSVFLWDGATLTQLVTEYWHALPVHWQRFILGRQINAD